LYRGSKIFKRASEWAKRRYGKDAAVIGAVIDLGNCLNLTDSTSSNYLKGGYKLLKARCELTGAPLPEKKSKKPSRNNDIRVKIYGYRRENRARGNKKYV